MTSNQAIVLGELAKPAHQSIIPESVQAAVKLAKEDGITNEPVIAQLAVDLMVCHVPFILNIHTTSSFMRRP
jgi:hypothetical protein